MITVEEARRVMMDHVPPPKGESVPLSEALGRYQLDGALRSPVDHPMFTCSAVDGYAFPFDEHREWKVVLEIAAGQAPDVALRPGECARIFTGAMLPPSADTTVMQEFVVREGDRITHSDQRLKKNSNVRFQGEQFRAGTVVHERGQLFTPQAIGLLAGLGITEAGVARSPRVHVITTGGEFTAPDKPLPGRVFSSNDIMLATALRMAGLDATVSFCADDADQLGDALNSAVRTCDLVITTGGASVGDHDLIHPVLQQLGADIHFHGVAQKPGKPMLFATLNNAPVFALPGNPRAVMILYWEYVLPFLRAMQGASDPWPLMDRLPLSTAITIKGERAEFRSAQVRGGKVMLLPDEGSHMLGTLTRADALAYVPHDVRSLNEGDLVEVHHLPR